MFNRSNILPNINVRKMLGEMLDRLNRPQNTQRHALSIAMRLATWNLALVQANKGRIGSGYMEGQVCVYQNTIVHSKMMSVTPNQIGHHKQQNFYHLKI